MNYTSKNLTYTGSRGQFDYYSGRFQGGVIKFRIDNVLKAIYVLFDDAFARANGYRDKAAMCKDIPELKGELEACFGNSEHWMTYDLKRRDFIAYKKSALN